MTLFLKSTTTIFWVLSGLIITILPASAIDDVDPSEIDSLFAEWAADDKPGGVVGVLLDGELIYSNAFGRANLEQPAYNTLATRFNIASVSKETTAFAALLLEEEGRLDLQDDIRDYLPELHGFGETITIYHLLHHLSGLRNFNTLLALTGLSEDNIATREQTLRLIFDQRELNFSPGTRAAYSNTNFLLLALIVERVSGQSFRDFTTEKMFAPLGMENSFYSDQFNEVIPDRAWGHKQVDNSESELDMPMNYSVGAAGLVTTLNDYARWDKNFLDASVGSAQLIQTMLEKGVMKHGHTTVFASGTGNSLYRGLKMHGMAGSSPGYRSVHVQYPDSGLSIIIFANSSYNLFPIYSRIAELYLGEEMSAAQAALDADADRFIALPANELEKFGGAYKSVDSPDVLYVYVNSDNGPLVTSGSGFDMRVAPLSETSFENSSMEDDTQVLFDFASDGSQSIQIVQNDVPLFEGKALSSVDSTSDYLRQFVGSYYSVEIGSSFELVFRDGRLYRTKQGLPDRILESRFTDLFEAGGFTGTHWFERDSNDAVSGFRISVAGVNNLLYSRQ